MSDRELFKYTATNIYAYVISLQVSFCAVFFWGGGISWSRFHLTCRLSHCQMSDYQMALSRNFLLTRIIFLTAEILSPLQCLYFSFIAVCQLNSPEQIF